MTKIEAIIRPEKLDEIKPLFDKLEINGLTISQVMGCGKQKGWKEIVRGTEIDYNFLPKIKLEMVVSDDQVERVVNTLVISVRTGEVGDGKIFLSHIDDAIRIRTNERGEAALK